MDERKRYLENMSWLQERILLALKQMELHSKDNGNQLGLVSLENAEDLINTVFVEMRFLFNKTF